ncbi:MAG TPA: DUF2946 family protein [Aliidongia sp.]|nr:DUF2946 family protein [Aliidongia sp.]
MLALFALLCQSLILLPPQPALALPADGSPFPGGYILCVDDDGGGTAPGSADDKAPYQHCADCLACQAFHHASGLVPPAMPAVPAPAVQALAFIPAVVATRPLRLVARAHQPRAPPSIASL